MLFCAIAAPTATPTPTRPPPSAAETASVTAEIEEVLLALTVMAPALPMVEFEI
jgi:hypothetical protein